jgi:xanthine dehydrogenase YagR molybdenum-binding subunit
MPESDVFVGTPRSRVDGREKVTGTARYAGEFAAPGLLHGHVVSSGIAKGRIVAIDAAAAEALPGVIAVITHANRRETAAEAEKYQDMVAPPGAPFRALADDRIVYSGQPVALVVAENLELARHAATLLRISYHEESPTTDLQAQSDAAYEPPEKRNGIAPPPEPRGDVARALAQAPVRLERSYSIPIEYHNPMEPHATTVVWEAGDRLTVYDKIQGVVNTHDYIAGVFDLPKDAVRVISPYVGGAFGIGLRPQYQCFLAVLAALQLQRSVRVVLTRAQMFTMGYRPVTLQTVRLGATEAGTLLAVDHEALAGTSQFEDYQEVVVNWSGLLYQCDNVSLRYRLAKLDTYTPADMRAPGAPLGIFAIESAMDELSYRLGMDPLALRLKNYAERDANEDKPFTSKALRAAYAQGAARFGWDRRSAAPRSMRDGRELVGWGLATGVWEAMMMETSARATWRADGVLEVATATADIGTGTYTILSQIAADALGVPMDQVVVKIGDTSLPASPIEGGSWTAASAGSAVQAACDTLRGKLLAAARGIDESPLANASLAQVVFSDGKIRMANDPARAVRLADLAEVAAEEKASRDEEVAEKFASYTHAAVFAEVRVDEQLGTVRVARVVQAIAAGRILNPKTARSQILGGVVMGIGMALTEAAMTDHRLGRVMNRNLAEYHVPVNADVHDIDVIFVDEPDARTSPIGVKGVGEIGLVGTAAAIANAIFHATGRRPTDLPITIDKVLPPPA